MRDKSYRITILLYIGILILPFAFYYTWGKLKSIEAGTEVIRQLGRRGGEMLVLPAVAEGDVRTGKIQKIDATLHQIKPWVERQSGMSFYVGTQSLAKDYDNLMKCWEDLKRSHAQKDARQCWEKVKSILFMIERMVTLEQERVKNLLYATLAGSMILLLLIVFFVRSYIRYQMLKQDIYDSESHLFNQKYCLVSAERICAQSDRSGHSFSILSLRIKGLESCATQYGKEERIKLLEAIGGYLAATTRLSDIACRYDEDHFLILRPETDAQQCRIPEKRIEEGMKEHMLKIVSSFKMAIHTITRLPEEECAGFLKRVEKL